MTIRSARVWHALTAAVTIGALALQFVLVLLGGSVLDKTEPDPLLERLGQFTSYFTIQSNALVAVAVVMLVRDPLRDGPVFRVVRLAGTVGIFVTGIVHFFLLRPLLDLDGADWVADKLLHMAVPLLVTIGFVLFGPRPRIDLRDIKLAICWPLAWTLWTLVVGALVGWYPYPFLDPGKEHGVPGVVIAVAGITVFFLAVFALARLVDQRAQPAPQAWDPYRNQ